MKRILTVVVVCALMCVAFGKALEGTVKRVLDGDTILIGNTKVRLDRIDAPELSQEFGQESAAYLASLIYGKYVYVEYTSTDQHGRIIGIVYCCGYEVNLQMIEDGYAWHYKQYDTTSSYANAESTARMAKRGLWAYPNPIPPWDFRSSNSEQRPVGTDNQGQTMLSQIEYLRGNYVSGYGPNGEPIFGENLLGGMDKRSDLEKAYKRWKMKQKEDSTRRWNDSLMSGGEAAQYMSDRRIQRARNRYRSMYASEMARLINSMADLQKRIYKCYSPSKKKELEHELENKTRKLDELGLKLKEFDSE